MVWCSHCGKDQRTEQDDINGYVCCTGCGRVVEDTIFSSDPTFIKTAGGDSQFAGNFVRDNRYGGYGYYSGSGDDVYRTDSHERTLERGRQEIQMIADHFNISEVTVEASHRLYILAVDKNFTKGRRVSQVAAACLYIICREEKKPYLLIDFSDVLQINVYVLGAVFLQLCKLLRLEQHPIVQKPVDPSLFIHRFADRLVGRSTTRKQCNLIINVALRIMTSMKHNWLQTGRKPSGLCGAALYIAAHAHRVKCTKSDVVSVVHVCEATLTKRLTEFEDTESGDLTIEEFENKAKELEAEMQLLTPSITEQKGKTPELVCEHKDSGVSHFAHGLCRECYKNILEISGGLHGGANPPAFKQAEEKRKSEALLKQQSDGSVLDEWNEANGYGAETLNSSDKDLQWSTKYFDCSNDDDQSRKEETLSDIDDEEVDKYLHDEEEVRLKTKIWTEMNKEYLEEIAAKEAAIAAAEAARAAAREAALKGDPDALELERQAEAAVAKLKKEKQRKRAEEKKRPPAQTAAEAARQMLTKKKLSSKVNYDVLEKLFNSDKSKATDTADAKEDPGGEEDSNSNTQKRKVTFKEDDSHVKKQKTDDSGIDHGETQESEVMNEAEYEGDGDGEADEYYNTAQQEQKYTYEDDYYDQYGGYDDF